MTTKHITQREAPSTERLLLVAMRAYNESLLDQGDEGRANSLALQAALIAHRDAAGKPVAWMSAQPGGAIVSDAERQAIMVHRGGNGSTYPIPLYANQPEQPVEAVDAWVVADHVRAALDRRSCPDAYMQIAVQAVLAALAHPRPTGDGYDVARHNEWLEANEAPTTGRAGDVVAFRIVGRHGPYPWVDGKPEPEFIVGAGERLELAYAQPSTPGLPDDLVSIALEANDMCRASFQVAERVATQYATVYAGTNFGALHEQLKKSLDRQHRVLKPYREAMLAAAPEVPRG